MRTGDGETEDTGALTREENVIRLPRDWLGPPEELVPIGPAARARAAQRELDGGTAPTADAFWSEDSAALHDAVQAPAAASTHLDTPVGLVPPLAGRRRRTLSRLPRLRLGGARTSRWWGVAAVPIVALVVAAVIGMSESPASHPAAHHGSISRTDGAAHHGTVAPIDAERLASASKAASAAAATGRAGKRATRRQHTPVRRSHARTRVRSTRHTTSGHVTAAHHSTGPPAPTVTEAAAAPPSTQSSAPTPAPSSSADSAASTGSTGSSASARGSTPATGPAGPTRIGSVTGGCSPKCS